MTGFYIIKKLINKLNMSGYFVLSPSGSLQHILVNNQWYNTNGSVPTGKNTCRKLTPNPNAPKRCSICGQIDNRYEVLYSQGIANVCVCELHKFLN